MKETDSVNGMYVTVVCSECGGTGKVTIYNAYDADYVEEKTCPSCYGTGVVAKECNVNKDLN